VIVGGGTAAQLVLDFPIIYAVLDSGAVLLILSPLREKNVASSDSLLDVGVISFAMAVYVAPQIGLKNGHRLKKNEVTI
jgi:hypothetical protein